MGSAESRKRFLGYRNSRNKGNQVRGRGVSTIHINI